MTELSRLDRTFGLYLVLILLWAATAHLHAAEQREPRPGPQGEVEYFLLHEADLYRGQPGVGVSLKLTQEPDGQRARVEMFDGAGRAVLAHDLGELSDRLSRATVPVDALAEGEYRAVCRVLTSSGEEIGSDDAVLRVAALPAPQGLRIPIRVAYAPRTTDGRAHVTVGVPFARGALPATDVEAGVTLLDPEGRAVAADVRPVAYWGPERRFVQWLHVDAVVPTPATGEMVAERRRPRPPSKEGELDFTLVYTPRGAAAEAGSAAEAEGVRVSRARGERGGVVLNNGLLRITLDPAEANPFADLRLADAANGTSGEGDQLLTEHVDAGFFLRDEQHREYRPAPPWDVRVEKDGPTAATVRLQAALQREDGHTIGHLIVRVRQSAALARFDVAHTFVYTDTGNAAAQIRGMGLRMPFAGADTVRMGLDDFGYGEELKLDRGPVRLLQPSFYQCNLEQGPPEARRLVRFADMAPGWLDLATPRFHAVVGFPTQRFWKEYPKELYVEPSGMTWINLVPALADVPLDLRTNERNDFVWPATGFAKTHEFTFDFYRGEARSNRANLELTYGEPVAWADHAYSCGTEVVGLLTPVELGDNRADEWASQVRKLMWYGILDYGDSAGVGGGGWYLRQTGRSDYLGRRYRFQHEQTGPRWLTNNWLAFIAGGDRHALDKAHTITRHMQDVDSIHVPLMPTPYNGSDPIEVNAEKMLEGKVVAEAYLGSHHNHGGSQQHWSGKALPVGHTSSMVLMPRLMAWNLIGDERGLDTALEWGRGLLAMPEMTPDTYTTRRAMGAAEGATRMYQQTWDPAYLEAARERWNTALAYHESGEQGDIEVGGFWNNAPYIFYAAEPYYALTGDPRVAEVMRARPPWGRRNTAVGDLVAYHLFKDPQDLKSYLGSRLEDVVKSAPPEVMRAAAPADDGDDAPPAASPWDWLTRERLHTWLDPEDDLFVPTAKRLAQEAVAAGTLSNVPSRRLVTTHERMAPRVAMILIVEKKADEAYVIAPVQFMRNTAEERYTVWDRTGQRIIDEPVPGLRYTGSSRENGRVEIPAPLPAGLYRIRISHLHGPEEKELPRYGGYTELTFTMPARSRWMIETGGSGGFPAPKVLWGEETFARFVVPEGERELEIFLTGDTRIGRWLALLDPTERPALVMENIPANHVHVGEETGYLIKPVPSAAVTPGVWQVGLQPNTALEARPLKGALPYTTFDADAVFTAHELRSLPTAWEGD